MNKVLMYVCFSLILLLIFSGTYLYIATEKLVQVNTSQEQQLTTIDQENEMLENEIKLKEEELKKLKEEKKEVLEWYKEWKERREKIDQLT